MIIPGVAAGHIPGARNLPYAALYRDDGTFKSREELEAAFEPGKEFCFDAAVHLTGG